jgi:hypothetical protein
VLEEGDLPGLAVVLELDGLLSPGDLPPPPASGDRGDDRQHRRDRRGVRRQVTPWSRQCRNACAYAPPRSKPSMIFAPGPTAFFSSASALGNVTVSPDGSPVTKHTARPSYAVTCVSARPFPARPR